MASGYEDYVREIEKEKLQVLKDNPILVEKDLIVTKTGIEFTENALVKLKAEENRKLEAEKAGEKFVPYSAPVVKEEPVKEEVVVKVIK